MRSDLENDKAFLTKRASRWHKLSFHRSLNTIHHERQITHWEAFQSNRQKLTLELTTYMELVKRLKLFWDTATGEDRKILAHSLFDEIIYDHDARRIVEFKVKTWAEPYLILRAALYENDMDEETKNRCESGSSSEVLCNSPNGKKLEQLHPQNPRLVEFLQSIAFPQSAEFTSLMTV